jgi:hypothetical protein
MGMNQPKWEEIHEIVLDMSPVFYHYIEIRNKKRMLLDKIKVPPEKSMDIFIELNKRWEEEKKTNA